MTLKWTSISWETWMNLYERIAELNLSNHPFVLATIVKSGGSVPGKVGFKILVEKDGTATGTVGGGALEQRVITECLERMGTGASGIQEYILREKPAPTPDSDGPEVISMMCNGKVWVYYEVTANLPEVYIFGGGHVGQALCYFLHRLNYRIILIDNREEFATEAKNPYPHQRILDDYVNFAQNFKPAKNAFIVIMTQGHGFDYKILKVLYRRQLSLKYIGVIASRSKSTSLVNKLKQDFGENVNLSLLHSPVGLAIGGNTKNEIALSIAAEIQAVCFGKDAQHLKTMG